MSKLDNLKQTEAKTAEALEGIARLAEGVTPSPLHITLKNREGYADSSGASRLLTEALHALWPLVDVQVRAIAAERIRVARAAAVEEARETLVALNAPAAGVAS